jgi:hypothetical protein
MIFILRNSVLNQDTLTPDPFPGLLLNPVSDSDEDFLNERFLRPWRIRIFQTNDLNKPLENSLALQAALWIRDSWYESDPPLPWSLSLHHLTF